MLHSSTVEYLPLLWFLLGPLIFVMAAVNRWLLPLTVSACGRFVWHFWWRFSQVERMIMATIRYIIEDVDQAITFYTRHTTRVRRLPK